MKKLSFIAKGISLFFLLFIFSMQAKGQPDEGIQNIQPIPSVPNNAEDVQFVVDAFFNNGTCFINEYEVEIYELSVLIRICYLTGNTHIPCWPKDTITIGQLPAGDFEFVFQAFKYTIADGCFEQEVSTDTMHLTVEPHTASEIPAEASGITLLPNPFTGYINVQVEQHALYQPVLLRLYDYTGREVLNRGIESGTTHTISTEHLPPGVYLYRMKLDNGQEVSGKVVKQ